jgi:hypothetical protein
LDSDNTEGVSHALADIEELERAAQMPDLTRTSLSSPVEVPVDDFSVSEIVSAAIAAMNTRSSSPFRDAVVEKKSALKDGDVYEVRFTSAQTTCRKRVSPAQAEAGAPVSGACEKDFSALDIGEVSVRARLRDGADPPAQGADGKWTLAFLGAGPSAIRAMPVSGWV